MTPSAISHQIKALEAFLQRPLFERRTREVRLTNEGQAYLAAVGLAFGNLQQATRALMGRTETEAMRLAVAPAFLDRWLLPRFQRFTDQYPDIELDILSATGEIDFGGQQVDFAIYYGDGRWPAVESLFLRGASLVPVCAPELLEQERVEEPEDLLRFRLLQVRERPEEWQQWFQLSQTPVWPSQGTISFSSSQTATQAAIQGLGVALTDPTLASEEIEQGALMVPIEQTLTLPKAFYLVWPKQRAWTPAMQRFRDWVVAQM